MSSMCRRCVGRASASQTGCCEAAACKRAPATPILASSRSSSSCLRLPLALVALTLAACSQGASVPDPGLGVTASPRVAGGRSVPKGGGIYKVGKPYKVGGRWYRPRVDPNYDRTGTASWYGEAFHGRRTANGEIYDMYALTAGHPTLPLPSYAYVTNRDNGRTILVRINDRGPYVNDRLIDLSWQSARALGYTRHGLARVRVRYAGRAPLDGNDLAERRHLAAQSWYEGNLRVAGVPSAPLTTGSLAERDAGETGAPVGAVAAAAGGRAALGGPGGAFLDIGPFATQAEAERMGHELQAFGVGQVQRRGTRPEPAFHVRMGPLSPAAAAALARDVAGFATVSAAEPPRHGRARTATALTAARE